MNPTPGSKHLWLSSPLLAMFAPDFKELELLFKTSHPIGVVKDRLNKLRNRILFMLPTMTPQEFELIAESHQTFYMLWLACICYYGGGTKQSLAYFRAAKYN